jgi:hypothetical protein
MALVGDIARDLVACTQAADVGCHNFIAPYFRTVVNMRM